MDPSNPIGPWFYPRLPNASTGFQPSGTTSSSEYHQQVPGPQSGSTSTPVPSTTSQLLLQAAHCTTLTSSPFAPTSFLSQSNPYEVFFQHAHTKSAHYASNQHRALASAVATSKQPVENELPSNYTNAHSQSLPPTSGNFFEHQVPSAANSASLGWHPQGAAQLPSPFGVLPHESVPANSSSSKPNPSDYSAFNAFNPAHSLSHLTPLTDYKPASAYPDPKKASRPQSPSTSVKSSSSSASSLPNAFYQSSSSAGSPSPYAASDSGISSGYSPTHKFGGSTPSSGPQQTACIVASPPVPSPRPQPAPQAGQPTTARAPPSDAFPASTRDRPSSARSPSFLGPGAGARASPHPALTKAQAKAYPELGNPAQGPPTPEAGVPRYDADKPQRTATGQPLPYQQLFRHYNSSAPTDAEYLHQRPKGATGELQTYPGGSPSNGLEHGHLYTPQPRPSAYPSVITRTDSQFPKHGWDPSPPAQTHGPVKYSQSAFEACVPSSDAALGVGANSQLQPPPDRHPAYFEHAAQGTANCRDDPMAIVKDLQQQQSVVKTASKPSGRRRKSTGTEKLSAAAAVAAVATVHSPSADYSSGSREPPPAHLNAPAGLGQLQNGAFYDMERWGYASSMARPYAGAYGAQDSVPNSPAPSPYAHPSYPPPPLGHTAPHLACSQEYSPLGSGTQRMENPSAKPPSEPSSAVQAPEENPPTRLPAVEQFPTNHHSRTEPPPARLPSTEQFPTELPPARLPPVDQFSTNHSPTEQPLTRAPPVDQFSTNHSPTEQPLTRAPPVDQFPTNHLPIEQPPTSLPPVDQFPANHLPAELAMAGQAPLEPPVANPPPVKRLAAERPFEQPAEEVPRVKQPPVKRPRLKQPPVERKPSVKKPPPAEPQAGDTRVIVPDISEELAFLDEVGPVFVKKAEKGKSSVAGSGFEASYLRFLQGEREDSPPPISRAGRKPAWARPSPSEPAPTPTPVTNGRAPSASEDEPAPTGDGDGAGPAEDPVDDPRYLPLPKTDAQRKSLDSSDSDSDIDLNTKLNNYLAATRQAAESQASKTGGKSSAAKTKTPNSVEKGKRGRKKKVVVEENPLPRRETSRRKAKEKTNMILGRGDDFFADEPDLGGDSDSDPVWTPVGPKPKMDSDDEEFVKRKGTKRSAVGKRLKVLDSSEDEDEPPAKVVNPRPAPTGAKRGRKPKNFQNMSSNDSKINTGDSEEFPFKIGEFVVLRTDLSEKCPPIWRVDGKTLLQKFEPFEDRGETLYKNTLTYSGWSLHNTVMYQAAEVRFRTQNRSETILEFVRDQLLEFDKEVLEKLIMETACYQDNFEVYIQTLISQALDSNFLTEIFQEEDEYFLTNVKSIDDIVADRKKKLLCVMKWKPELERSIVTWPCYDVIFELTSEELQKNCEGCDKPKVSARVLLYGQPYNATTLEGCQPDPTLVCKKDLLTCKPCLRRVELYNKVAHQKYLMFIQCAKRVAEKRAADESKDTTKILNMLLADEKWLNELFRNVRLAWAEIDLLNKSSAAESDDNSPPLESASTGVQSPH